MSSPAGQLILDEAVAVVLNAAGFGQVTIGPRRPLQTWRVTTVAVSVTTNVAEPVFRLFLGNPVPSNLIGGSYSGSNDSDNQLSALLRSGNVLTGTWTGGDPGARATMSIYGDLFTGRQ